MLAGFTQPFSRALYSASPVSLSLMKFLGLALMKLGSSGETPFFAKRNERRTKKSASERSFRLARHVTRAGRLDLRRHKDIGSKKMSHLKIDP